MAGISLSGLSSGIDTASIIEKLMQVEQRKLTLLNNNLGKYSDKKTAITGLESKVSSFKTALNNLSSLSKLKAFNTKTGDEDIVTASASSSAQEGSHSIQIKQLATAERLVHDGASFSSKSSLVGTGTFIYSYNYQEVVVTTTAETTLEQLVTQINGDTNNPGVTASLLEYDDGTGRWHLVLAGKETGAENEISINSSRTQLKTADSALTYASGGANAKESTRINELEGYTLTSSITIDGTRRSGATFSTAITINDYTTVEDVMDEIKAAYNDEVNVILDEGILKVTDKVSGDPDMDIDLTFTGGTTSTLNFTTTVIGGTQPASLTNFAAANFDQTQAAQDALIKVDGYPADVYDTGVPPTLIEEKWMSRSSNSISDVIDGVTLSLQTTTQNATTPTVYDSISVSLTRDTETLKENLTAMISAYNAIVSYIDDNTTYDTENKKMGILSDSYSISSISTLITSPLRSTPGGFTSSDTFTTPQDIGLEINADGTLELDSTAFDDAVAEDYTAVLNLIGAQQVGSSFGGAASYISFYGAANLTDAGSYDVEVIKSGGVITSAKIKLTTESSWRPMTVDEDGTTLYCNTEMFEGEPLYPEYSMVLTVDSSAPNETMTTTVNVRQGFGDNLYDMVTQMLKKDGRIDLAKTSINDQISDQQYRIDTEETRLEKYQQRLQSKYARLEAALNSMQQQMSTVSAMM